MHQRPFKASVQYNDLTGTVAADRSDQHSLLAYLQQHKLILADEHLVGVEMLSGEVHAKTQEKPVHVTALVTSLEGFDTVKAAVESGVPLEVRQINLEMTLAEFFGLFKRFEVSLSNGGLLTNRTISIN